MKLSPQLEEQVKEEIWVKIAERLGKTDIDLDKKEISLTYAEVKLTLLIDLDVETEEG